MLNKIIRAFGYDWSELYATTYANGSQGSLTQWAKYTMECKYVKQVFYTFTILKLNLKFIE